MDALYAVLFIAALVLSIVSLVFYLRKRFIIGNEHKQIMAELQPARQLSSAEQENFTRLYKQKLPEGEPIPVYRHEGSVGYISISINHAEVKQYTFGGIKIALAGLERLRRVLKEVNFDLIAVTTNAQSEEKVKAVMEKYKDSTAINEERIKEELKNALSEFNHTFELVFLKNDATKPGFLVKFDDWSLAEMKTESLKKK
jgi:hypothetical protein